MTKIRALVVTVLSLVSLVLLAVTTVEPDWIEEVFEVAPDNGSGAAEVLLTWTFVVLTIALGVGAVLSWRSVLMRRGERSR